MKIDKIKKTNFEGKLICYTITYIDSNFQKLVPLKEGNTDYQFILKWIEDGNPVEEAD
jgi:hypothetical protein|tara:strand:- start:31 stop:204 length:174 start_codon:yes stop_codon:yes gene_type:complete